MVNQNQTKFFNKGISTSIGILIILCAILAGGIFAWQHWGGPEGVEPSEITQPQVVF